MGTKLFGKTPTAKVIVSTTHFQWNGTNKKQNSRIVQRLARQYGCLYHKSDFIAVDGTEKNDDPTPAKTLETGKRYFIVTHKVGKYRLDQ